MNTSDAVEALNLLLEEDRAMMGASPVVRYDLPDEEVRLLSNHFMDFLDNLFVEHSIGSPVLFETRDVERSRFELRQSKTAPTHYPRTGLALQRLVYLDDESIIHGDHDITLAVINPPHEKDVIQKPLSGYNHISPDRKLWTPKGDVRGLPSLLALIALTNAVLDVENIDRFDC